MKNVIVVLLSIVFMANFAVSEDNGQQQNFSRLILERSKLLQKLEQETSEETKMLMLSRIREIDSEIQDMEIEEPYSPAPPLSEMDRADLRAPHPPVVVFNRRTCNFRIDVSPSYINNYFQAVAGTPRQAVSITNVSSSFSFPLVQDNGQQLWANVSAERNFVHGIENGDWNIFGVRLNYVHRNQQLAFHGIYSPRKLTFISGDNQAGLAQTLGLGADYTARLSRKARLRLFYRWNGIRYPGFDGRNSDVHFAAGDVQYRFHNLFIPGIGFEQAINLASSDNYNHKTMSPVLLLGVRLGRIASVNLRYRYRARNYSIKDSQLSNFGRKDFRHDASMYTGIGLGPKLYLTLFGSYTQNSSSRANRSFSSYSAGATLQFQLLSRQPF